MDVAALLKPYLTPADPPLDLPEVLKLGLLGDQVRVFHVCGILTTTSSWADVWPSGGTRTNPSSAASVLVASSLSSDNASGNGARRVEVYGWDSSWDLAAETVALNGATSVATSTSYSRVISLRVTEAGSNGSNLGTISATLSSQTMATISPGDNASLHSHFTIPPAHIGYVYDWRFSAAKGGGEIDHGAIRFCHRPDNLLFYPHEEHMLTEGHGLNRSGPLLVAEAEAELVVRARSTGSGSNRDVTTSYQVAVFPGT
jgi:hypothetical protein